MVRPKSELARWTRWFANPWVGLIGTLASVIGFGFAIFTYVVTKRERELTFLVHPDRTVIVDARSIQGLTVIQNGREVRGSVTSAKMVVWNSGRESIHPEHRLRPVNIVTNPQVRILEAKLLKRTRDVTALSLNGSLAASGIIGLDWKILEHMDGASIQLIYEGSPNVKVTVDGTIEGQNQIRAYQVKGRAALEPQTVGVKNPVRKAMFWIAVGLFGISCVVFANTKRRKDSSFRGGEVLILSILCILIGISILRSPAPPFIL